MNEMNSSLNFNGESERESSDFTQNIEIPMNVLVNSGAVGGVSISGQNGQTTLLGIGADTGDASDRLRFHTRCGSLVKLSANNRTAERRRALDEFNNGVVMTHRPLRDNELFEIRIDKLVDKWSGSIEVGVTTHNPAALHFPATMTNMRSGTIMMSGCGILTNGKGTRREYGEFNLDELREGDRVGMMKKSNGNLHYYINGKDQGVAATRIAQILWGVIDLYGMTIKVTIVERDEREQMNLMTRRNNPSVSRPIGQEVLPPVPIAEPDCANSTHRLTFHSICGSHACVTHSGRTALRPNATEDFNNGVVLTRRPLRPNELFQVRLEYVVTKWAGSIEIGVTTHSPTELQFPFTMTNVRSGTWMMTGNGVMHNGITVLEQYGQNLDLFQVGDRVGVVRKDDGTLHFWVNGVDQGPAATNVPERVYGVIDLYGRAAQASIVDTSELCSPDTGNSTISNTTLYSSEPRLRFHPNFGKNVRVSGNGLSAHREKPIRTFDNAILFSNRPLRPRELFEVVLDTVLTHWKDSISIGVTGLRPDDTQLPSTATELRQDTLLLSGSSLLLNGSLIRNEFLPFHLDSLKSGSRLGVMLNGDFVHFYVDGVDYGPAYECKVQNVFAVIDLYGQCSKVNILAPQPDVRAPYATSENSQSIQATSVIHPPIGTKHRFSNVTSGDAILAENLTVAMTKYENPLSQGLIFSANPLEVGEYFEFKIMEMNLMYAGCLKVGVTDLNLGDDRITKNLPAMIKHIPATVYYVSCDKVMQNNMLLNRSHASLEWLRSGDIVTVELTSARTVRILLNSEEVDILFNNIDPKDLFVVIELGGATKSVEIISTIGPSSPLRPCSLRLQDSLEFVLDPLNKQDSMLESIDSDFFTFEFPTDFHGENVKIFDDKKTASRIKSYNNACIGIPKPLCKGHSICIKIEEVNPKWKGTLAIGAIGCAPSHINFQSLSSSLVLKRPCWIVTHDYINLNGTKTQSNYGEILDKIQRGTIVTMMLTHSGSLVLMVDKTNLEVFATGLPNHVYPVFDLYGKCEKITILNVEMRNGSPINEELPEFDTNIPQCEKADLEIHEKETEPNLNSLDMPATSDDTRTRNRTSENFWTNMTIKSRSKNELSNSTSLRDSLELQHSTNLNIQRSQSTQRFDYSNCMAVYSDSPSNNMSSSCHDSNYIDDGMCSGSLNSAEESSNYRTVNLTLPLTTLESEMESLLIAESENISETATQENPAAETSNSLTDFDSYSYYSLESENCDYFRLVCGFKKTLVLPDEFFSGDQPTCFCDKCTKTYSKCSLLQGWVRFKLNQETTNAGNIVLESDDKTLAFYSTRVDKIRSILDNGQLVPVPSGASSGQKDDGSGTHLVLSPSPNDNLNLHHQFNFRGYTYEIGTAFEVHVRTQSICVLEGHDDEEGAEAGPSTGTDGKSLWTTKEAGSCILSALLLKLYCKK